MEVPNNQLIKRGDHMSYHTETALAYAPGMIFSCLDGGGMVLDRDSGEYVPADQVIRDPLHLDQLDCLDEGHLGCLKFGFFDETASIDIDDLPDEDTVDEDGHPEDNNTLVDLETADHVAARELDALIAAQVADARSTHFVTCTKGRHREFGNSKDDNGRIWRPRTCGRHGNQLHKDRRLRANGSGKTTARDATW